MTAQHYKIIVCIFSIMYIIFLGSIKFIIENEISALKIDVTNLDNSIKTINEQITIIQDVQAAPPVKEIDEWEGWKFSMSATVVILIIGLAWLTNSVYFDRIPIERLQDAHCEAFGWHGYLFSRYELIRHLSRFSDTYILRPEFVPQNRLIYLACYLGSKIKIVLESIIIIEDNENDDNSNKVYTNNNILFNITAFLEEMIKDWDYYV